jgi:hypothetical protein
VLSPEDALRVDAAGKNCDPPTENDLIPRGADGGNDGVGNPAPFTDGSGDAGEMGALDS